MNTKKLLCLLCALSLSGAAVAQENLVALAKAEKARRAKLRASSGPSKVYTESNRSGSADAATTGDAAAATDTAPAAGAAAANEKTPEELAAERLKEWTDKLQQTQQEIADLESVIQTNERNLASLINITPARADLAARVEADKQKLAQLQQTLVSLEDERRRAGLPRVR